MTSLEILLLLPPLLSLLKLQLLPVCSLRRLAEELPPSEAGSRSTKLLTKSFEVRGGKGGAAENGAGRWMDGRVRDGDGGETGTGEGMASKMEGRGG